MNVASAFAELSAASGRGSITIRACSRLIALSFNIKICVVGSSLRPTMNVPAGRTKVRGSGAVATVACRIHI